MTLTLELTPAQEARLREEAARAGVEPAALLLARAGISEQATPPQEDATLALFARWQAEDTPGDAAERAQRQQEGDALLNAVRENRFSLEGHTDLAGGDAA